MCLRLTAACVSPIRCVQWFHTRQKKAMREALEKIKAGELRIHLLLLVLVWYLPACACINKDLYISKLNNATS